MKLTGVLPVLLLTWVGAFTQPTLQRNQVYQIGDVGHALDSDSLPPLGSSGANVLWDFSGLAVDSSNVVTLTFGQADTTAYGNEFPESDIAQIGSFGGFKFYEYLISSDDKIEVSGDVFPGAPFAKTAYSDPKTVLNFPLTYGSSWTDECEYVISFPGIASYVGGGNASSTVDAYGTLKLPSGTFDDVLRVKIITFSIDTADLGLDLYERREVYDTTYVWLSPSYSGTLCSFNKNLQHSYYSLITPDTTLVDEEIIRDTSFTFDPFAEGTSGTRDVTPGRFALSIAPNPFTDQLQIRFNAERSQEMQFVMQDMQGRVVFVNRINASAGDNAIEVQLGDLPGGIYVALLHAENGADVQKLVHLSPR